MKAARVRGFTHPHAAHLARETIHIPKKMSCYGWAPCELLASDTKCTSWSPS